MSQFISLLALTLRAAAAGIAAETFVTHAGAVPAAGARVLGVTRAPEARVRRRGQRRQAASGLPRDHPQTSQGR